MLLAKHYAQTAAPTFGEADADDFHIAREIALEDVRGGMKAEGGSDEIDERRSGLEFESGEIAIAREVSLRLVPADARPVVGGLKREIHIFRGFQFEDGKAAIACDAQEIQDAALAGNLSEYVFEDVFALDGDINPGDILVDDGLHPGLCLVEIEGVEEVAGQSATSNPQAG